MGLKVYLGKNNFAKPDEGIFFFQFAHVLKRMFEDDGYDGILLGAPLRKGQSDRYLQMDAVIFAKNAIIIVDFKSHGGVITTPKTDDITAYSNGYWYTDRRDIDGGRIKGGSHTNPYDQVQYYKRLVRSDILADIPDAKNWYINTGVIFYGNNIDLSKAYIPERMKSNFFIADNNLEAAESYYYKIKSILNSKGKDDRTVDLSDTELTRIREKFVVEEELTDKYIDENTGVPKDELEEKDARIKSMQVELFHKEEELLNARKVRKGLELEIQELKKSKNLSPEISRKIDQIFYDVKTLKVADFTKNTTDDWKKEIAELKKEIAKASNKKLENSIYIVPNLRPKWLTALIGTMIAVAVAAILTVIIGLVVPKGATTEIKVTRPDNLEGPYTAYAYDGDTLNVYTDGTAKKVRLIGIEAPEIKSSYREAGCYGEQAKNYLIDKIRDKEIYLEYDETQGEVDVYDRLLRYVWIDDELVNLSLIADGYAQEWTFKNEYKYKNEFDQAQANAKKDGLGLWTTCAK